MFCYYKMRPKCVNLFLTETKNPPEALFSCMLSLCMFHILDDCPLLALTILFILPDLAPKHGRQRILEAQDSTAAVCRGGRRLW